MSQINETLHPILLKAGQVAKILNTSKSFVYGLIDKGEIPVVKIRSSVRVIPKDLEEYIQANREKGRHGKKAW